MDRIVHTFGENTLPRLAVYKGTIRANWTLGGGSSAMGRHIVGLAVDRLAAYEATGLDPQEVQQLIDEKASNVCDKCEYFYNYACHRDGVREMDLNDFCSRFSATEGGCTE